tara:strand:- start:15689 stop:21214 length:5526 start_codon:yes stop_codon:yes gene_type:complete
MAPKAKAIRLKGVRQNNLKNFDLDIPKGKVTVVTGLSGAGKSSLVFETLHAEGQRRYVETFNAYTRQFLETIGRPDVDSIENICPSIAIEQKNSVRTSRSTVGTMTELCDFFKVWFPSVATLLDPATGLPIHDDSPQTVWQKISAERNFPKTIIVGFQIEKPGNLDWQEIFSSLIRQGYSRAVVQGTIRKIAEMEPGDMGQDTKLIVIQDRLRLEKSQRNRFLEAVSPAFLHGHGEVMILNESGEIIRTFSEGLRSPETGRQFRAPQPALFSFNSPIGACPSCRGFGRVIGLNRELVVPDPSLTLNEGAIRPFQGKVYSNSLEDLRRQAHRIGLRMDIPWSELSDAERDFVWKGDSDYPDAKEDAWIDRWYGIDRFFAWLEKNVYKMHVRVFLSKYRSYDTCPECGGQRLGEESLCWKWEGYTLPDLYEIEVGKLRKLIETQTQTGDSNDILGPILQRLRFLDDVGLGYLTLNRSTRTLSGGETERVNLTTCLGTSMVDTLFVLDEPSVGLHPRDIDRLVDILRGLSAQGNTVVVVEHDERIMRAADRIIEIGPEPGRKGGEVVFEGTPAQICRSSSSLTGRYLAGDLGGSENRETRPVEMDQRKSAACGRLSIYGASRHNLQDVTVHLPLRRFVAISGVSGSGKSTLLQKVIHDGLLRQRGLPTDDPATIRDIDTSEPIGEIVRIDQSSLSKTPRSNPAVLTGAWNEFRKALAATDQAVSSDMSASTFSFNTGEGRCDHCQGLGYEQVEMQFLSDLYLPCPVCDGRRFKPEVLAIRLEDCSVDEILKMEVNDALVRFADRPAIVERLEPIQRVGLGYLPLGHPLNQLSGGESQRLKLVRHLGNVGKKAKKSGSQSALILIDEPTTGLHRHDIANLLGVFQELVKEGNSLVVVEHHPDVLLAADWMIEMGPGAGSDGGKIVAAGTPMSIAQGETESAPFLRDALRQNTSDDNLVSFDNIDRDLPKVAEETVAYGERPRSISVQGATEHNLLDVSVDIPHGKTTVIAGVSGSGKSTLAFDIIFAEGQRRFMESMSAYARQFVEQLPKPEVTRLTGLAPSVAIEQRVTHGTSKSTVATITEVAQYLRLLFARIGVQHNPKTGNAVTSLPETELIRLFDKARKSASSNQPTYIGAPLIRGRKGHHQPIADWAAAREYPYLICDGIWVEPTSFQKLDRYREHDVDVLLKDLTGMTKPAAHSLMRETLKLGQGTAFLQFGKGGQRQHFSLSRVDPETGETFPELEPKNFSWNSPRGWCPNCNGRGTIRDEAPEGGDEPVCPVCDGTRLGEQSRHVYLETEKFGSVNLPHLLSLNAPSLIETLQDVQGSRRDKAILKEILPEIRERLDLMDQIGLDYLTLDRSTRTLSGGEAQRIRLTSQLGSNLTGVLYVLDEPTIGLHARDNDRLLQSIETLKRRGNTVLIVEHDADVILNADRVIDMGPGAGIHGGKIVAQGTPKQIMKSVNSVTGKHLARTGVHPLRGERKKVPASAKDWIRLEELYLRNWKGDSVAIPRRCLTAVCGVSGAGKSTLVHEALHRSAAAAVQSGKAALSVKALKTVFAGSQSKVPLKKVSGLAGIRKVIEIDQAPIGKTSRSTPATYIGVFDLIRSSFAQLPEAKMRGIDSSGFSFNTKGGRCESCKGAGIRKLEMNFLPDASVICEECEGKRYRGDLLDIHWRGKSIADVLAMSFEEAADFFSFDRRIQENLSLMVETGLGYLRLGQPSPTLSGGEAQRLKLVSELAGSATGPKGSENLYLLEEPTIGLHLKDCERLTRLLHRLVDEGHTVIVVEHQPDILAEADYLLEIGPEGGHRGGELIFSGTPEELVQVPKSPTAACLRPLLRSTRSVN